MSLSKAFKVQRLKHDITIQDIADKMQMNSQQVYAHMREGSNISFNKLEQYCNAIGCTLSELIETYESLK